MSTPVIQYFGTSGTWVKPEGAVRVDIVLKGADGKPGALDSGATSAHPANKTTAAVSVAYAHGVGELSVDSFYASDLPDAVEVTVGKGGRPGGRDGYALIVTHLAKSEGGQS